jgi:cation transport regulator ChaC
MSALLRTFVFGLATIALAVPAIAQTGAKTATIGILAYGSLIDQPGPEIAEATVRTLTDGIMTPFRIEFARTSQTRAGAPTLVPFDTGGARVSARIFVLNVSEREAADRLWRREINAVGSGRKYRAKDHPGPNDVIVQRSHAFPEVGTVLYTKIGANIETLTAERLAKLAIESAKKLRDGRDGISYLINAKRNGIKTPLSDAYEQEILRATQTTSLRDALDTVRPQ